MTRFSGRYMIFRILGDIFPLCQSGPVSHRKGHSTAAGQPRVAQSTSEVTSARQKEIYLLFYPGQLRKSDFICYACILGLCRDMPIW